MTSDPAHASDQHRAVRHTLTRLVPARAALPLAVVAGFVIIVGVFLGPSLLGFKVFAATDLLVRWAPWYTGGPLPAVDHSIAGDSMDAAFPGYLEIQRRLVDGNLAWWSSLTGSGMPLLSDMFKPTLNPATAGLLVFPTWWAAGFAKLCQLIVALLGMTWWLRRLGAIWTASLLAGLVYCGSGFFVAWGTWQAQSTSAAFIPVVFWALERFMQERTARAGVPVSVAVGFLLLAGFPAVAGHALYAAAAYVLVRQGARIRSDGWPGPLRVALGSAVAVLVGTALSAVQLVPALTSLSGTDLSYRDGQFDDTLPPATLVTTVLPRVFTEPGAGPINAVEGYAFVGAAVIVLAVAAAAWPRMVGAPRGVTTFLAVGTVFVGLLIWRHGWWTDWMGDLPVLAQNRPGRLRDLFCFFLCALAGLGASVLLTATDPRARRRQIRTVLSATGAMIVAVAVAAVALHGRVDGGRLWPDVVAAVAAAASVLAVVLSLARPRAGRMATLALVAVLTVQVGMSVAFFWPVGDRANFYPENGLIAATRTSTGSDRSMAVDGFYGSTGQAVGLRTVNSHAFNRPEWTEYITAIDPTAMLSPTSTWTTFGLTSPRMSDPLLDRAAVSTVMAKTGVAIPGTSRTPGGAPVRAGGSTPTGPPVAIGPDPVVVGRITAQGVRAVALYLDAPVGDGSGSLTLQVRLRSSDGSTERTGTLVRTTLDRGRLVVPIAGEDLSAVAGPLTVSVGLTGADAALTGVDERTAVIGVVGPADDGLVEVYADGNGSVWKRTTSLPRIRWASQARVATTSSERLALLRDPALAPSTVVLDAAGPQPGGGPANLSVVTDTGNEVVVDVAAGTAGYLVLADSVASVWNARIDDKPTDLVPADDAFVGVYVPAGMHRVRLAFDTHSVEVGALVSGITILALVAVLVLRRRRRLPWNSGGATQPE